MPISVANIISGCEAQKVRDTILPLSMGRVFKQRAKLFREQYSVEVIERYKGGQTAREISQHYGFVERTILKILRENNVRIKTFKESSQRYTLNEHAFDVIDNERAAYFLGFLYADGSNIPEKGSIVVTQNIDDIDVLEKFLTFMKSNRPILFYQDKRTNSKKKKTAIINFGSKYLCKKLSECGVIKNKTFKTEFPSCVPKEMLHHFIRGYFDGDGSLSGFKQYRKIHYNITFTGTESLLNSIKEIAINQANVSSVLTYIRHPERNNNIRMIHIGRNADIPIFLDWMYKNATVYMDRKYKKYLEVISCQSRLQA